MKLYTEAGTIQFEACTIGDSERMLYACFHGTLLTKGLMLALFGFLLATSES